VRARIVRNGWTELVWQGDRRESGPRQSEPAMHLIERYDDILQHVGPHDHPGGKSGRQRTNRDDRPGKGVSANLDTAGEAPRPDLRFRNG
jgi:hypothetical protein